MAAKYGNKPPAAVQPRTTPLPRIEVPRARLDPLNGGLLRHAMVGVLRQHEDAGLFRLRVEQVGGDGAPAFWRTRLPLPSQV